MDFLSLIVLAVVAIIVISNLGKIVSGMIKLFIRLIIAGGALYVGYHIYTGQWQLSL